MSAIPPELRQVFADEAAQRLNRLSQQLMELEEAGPSAEVVDSLFRDAHTLKGSAGMMGFRSFADVAHYMEDVLDGVRAGTRSPTGPLIDALLAAVDGLRDQLTAVLDGTADDAALAALAARVKAAGEAGEAGEAGGTAGEPSAGGSGPRPTASPDEGVARVPIARIESMARLAGEAASVHTRLVRSLQERFGSDAALPPEVFALGTMVHELGARVGEARLVPLATIIDPLRRAVRDIAKDQGKAVRLDVTGDDVELDRGVLDRLADALLHLVRNAVDHGIEPPVERVQVRKKAQAVVSLSARQHGRDVVVTVADDGRGIDLDRVKERAGDPALSDEDALQTLFEPGFSTAAEVTSVSGRGVGLDVVRAALAPVRGRVDVTTAKGRGTTFVLTVPLTVAAVPCLLVRCDGSQYALPLASVIATRSPEPDDVPLGALLDVPVYEATATVLVQHEDRQASLSVDELVARRDVVVRAVAALPKTPVVAGAAIDLDGTVLVVLDAAGLLGRVPLIVRASAQANGATATATSTSTAAAAARIPPAAKPKVLVVDDARVAREMQVMVLTRAGYEVRVAENGAEALEVLRRWPADLALVDVEMPVMNGLELTEAVRADPVLRGTAVMMLTSLGSEEDRRRGMEAGADGYIVKGTFTAEALLESVARLLGREP